MGIVGFNVPLDTF